jgi:hypothetical protein
MHDLRGNDYSGVSGPRLTTSVLGCYTGSFPDMSMVCMNPKSSWVHAQLLTHDI